MKFNDQLPEPLTARPLRHAITISVVYAVLVFALVAAVNTVHHGVTPAVCVTLAAAIIAGLYAGPAWAGAFALTTTSYLTIVDQARVPSLIYIVPTFTLMGILSGHMISLARDARARQQVALDAEHDARLDAEHALARLTQFQKLTELLAAATRPATVARVFVDHGLAAIGAFGGTVALVDQARGDIEIVAAYGYREEAGYMPRMNFDEDIAAVRCIREGQPVYYQTLGQMTAAHPTNADFYRASHCQALAIEPLKIGGQTIGSLSFAFRHPRAFTDADRSLLTTMASMCAQAIERTSQYAE